jgi:hypothetical protein
MSFSIPNTATYGTMPRFLCRLGPRRPPAGSEYAHDRHAATARVACPGRPGRKCRPGACRPRWGTPPTTGDGAPTTAVAETTCPTTPAPSSEDEVPDPRFLAPAAEPNRIAVDRPQPQRHPTRPPYPPLRHRPKTKSPRSLAPAALPNRRPADPPKPSATRPDHPATQHQGVTTKCCKRGRSRTFSVKHDSRLGATH